MHQVNSDAEYDPPKEHQMGARLFFFIRVKLSVIHTRSSAVNSASTFPI